MKYVVLFVLASVLQASYGENLISVHPSVVQYDVVPQRTALYSAPSVHVSAPIIHGQVPAYAVHGAPAVSHHYSHTQTHPVAYVRPVHVLGGVGQIHQQPISHSSIHQSRYYGPGLAPAVQYQAYTNGQQNENPNAYGQHQSNNNNNYNNNYNSYGGEHGRTRKYQIRRPAIQKEYYDIEEKVIIRPAGSALIELDSSTIHPIGNQNRNYKFENSNTQQRQNPFINCHDLHSSTQLNQFSSTDNTYQPTTYSTPAQYTPTIHTTSTPSTPFPTTNYVSTPSYTSSTIQPPLRTFQPPYSDQTTRGDQFHSSSTPGSSTQQTISSSTPQQDIYVSSTTPVSVTIVDNNVNNTHNNFGNNQDIVYANDPYKQNNGSNAQYQNENGPYQFRSELPPTGDINHNGYKDTDQFYQELPSGRYVAPHQPTPQNVISKSNGEPTERNEYPTEYDNLRDRQTNGTNQNERYVDNNNNNNNNRGQNYQEAGVIRGRVISTTPAPANAQPSQHTNTRRIVLAKQVETVQEIEVPDNQTSSNYDQNPQRELNNNNNYNNNDNQYNNTPNVNCDNNNQNGNYQNSNSNYQNANSNYQNGNNQNGYYQNANSDYQNGNNYSNSRNKNYQNNNNYNNNNGQRNQQYSNANDQSNTSERFTENVSSNGYYIKATPSSANQRIIYVKPVSQEFAQQRATPPNRN